MPPKFAPNVAANIPPSSYLAHPREQVILMYQPPKVAGAPTNPPDFLAVGGSDIFTYGADTIVIATDDSMNRRNEWPRAKFHHFAGPNLRVWNQLCNYDTVANPITNKISRVPRLRVLGPTSAVRAPAFRSPTFRWIVMVNLPTYDPTANPQQGNLVQGFRGNGDQLYKAYINAFRVARQSRDYEVPNSVANTFIGLPGLLPGAGLAGVPTPIIGFSFMGPSHGWDVQEAANIAMTAFRDSFWRQPFGGTYYGENDVGSVIANRVAFTNVSINGTFDLGREEPGYTRIIPPGPKYHQHTEALRRAFAWQFQGGSWPQIPGVPNPPPLAAIPANGTTLVGPAPPAPQNGVPHPAPAAPPAGTRVHRSGRWF